MSRKDRIANEILMYFRSRKKSAGELSLSEAIETDKDGGTLSLIDVISSEDDVMERLGTLELLERLRESMDICLSPREAAVIRARYGIGGGACLTQREVAARFGISRSYVSRIEKKALAKLRERLETE